MLKQLVVEGNLRGLPIYLVLTSYMGTIQISKNTTVKNDTDLSLTVCPVALFVIGTG